jgi:S-DNA-T family DNA segregation ATPase FtsK/SpoIIIE
MTLRSIPEPVEEHLVGRIELRVTVRSGLDERDLRVIASGANTVGQVAEMLVHEFSQARGDRETLWCERRQTQLPSELPLARADIRWGDTLVFGRVGVREPTRLGGETLVELIIAGGPSAGQRFQLGSGSYVVGRGDTADVSLTDPSLSRHHLDIRVDRSGVHVADAGSRNGTALNGVALPSKTLRDLGTDEELELGRSLLRFKWLSSSPRDGVTATAGRIPFNRPPRVLAPAHRFTGDISSPPDNARKARIPLAASVVPLLAGLVLFLVLKSPVMLAVAGLSPLMAITTFLGDRRGGRKTFARKSQEFERELARVTGELDEALRSEAQQRRAASPDAAVLIERLQELAPSLWERRPDDRDFLHLRLGVADLQAESRATIGRGGDQALREAAEATLAQRSTVTAVPMVVSGPSSGVIGLAGPSGAVDGLARWLIVQCSILHSPADLVMLAALSEERLRGWSWLKWLPHLRPDRVTLESGGIAIGLAATEKLLRDLRDLVSQRRQQSTRRQYGPPPTQILLTIDGSLAVDRALVTATLTGVADAGITVIWLGRQTRDLPGQSTVIIEADPDRSVLRVTHTETGEVQDDVSADAIEPDLAERVARELAPIQDAGELARAGDIPKRIALLDLLSLLPPQPAEIEQRWTSWRGDLGVTIGVGAEGRVTIDLREEGPHALIAGTTGSGKSELLRTFIAAAAASAPPHRLTFLLVDYKGGAAFAPCARFPHVLDVVSDLDEHMAGRALLALNAELKRRERILASAGAKDLVELGRRSPDSAPPLLIIAVDEFAKLREEVPEFVDGVVDIAQRGRSLGIHMVLAAQTLRNAFTSAIRANTNLRLALRVAEESESEDVIDSPLAARIPSGEGYRGRAFVRTGQGELREVQTAYVSGLSDAGRHRALVVEAFDVADGSAQSFSASAFDSDHESDLVLLGEAFLSARERLQLPIPPPPWLPMLSARIPLETLDAHDVPAEGFVIGLVDLPTLQRQDPLVVELASVGNVAVFGAGSSGKSTTLLAAAAAAARRNADGQLHIYGLDAGGGGLDLLNELPACAAVIEAADEERLHRLLNVLTRRVESRREATGPRRILLLLDDFDSLMQQYERPGSGSVQEKLLQILSGGRGAGVHVVVSATRRASLPPAMAAHFGQRLILRMATEDDLLAMGLEAKAVRGARLPPGRGFTQESQEFQIAVPSLDLLREGTVAPEADIDRIEALPSLVRRASLPAGDDLQAVALGIDDVGRRVAKVDLTDRHFLVVGPYRSGRSTALETIALGASLAPVELHLIAPRRSPLRGSELWRTEATNSESAAELTHHLGERLGNHELDDTAVLLFVDDAGELTDAILMAQLEALVKKGRDSALRIVAAAETGAARGLGCPWVREIRREGHGLLLSPDLLSDGDLLGVRLPRRVAAPLVTGRGFLVNGGVAELIQVAVA